MFKLFKIWYATYRLFKYRKRKLDITRIAKTIEMLKYISTIHDDIKILTFDYVESNFDNYSSLAKALKSQVYFLTRSHSLDYSTNRATKYISEEWFTNSSSYSVDKSIVLKSLLDLTIQIDTHSTDGLKEVLLLAHSASWDSIDMYIEFIINCYKKGNRNV